MLAEPDDATGAEAHLSRRFPSGDKSRYADRQQARSPKKWGLGDAIPTGETTAVVFTVVTDGLEAPPEVPTAEPLWYWQFFFVEAILMLELPKRHATSLYGQPVHGG